MKKLMSMLLLAVVCTMPLAATTIGTVQGVKKVDNKRNVAAFVDYGSSKEEVSFETISGSAFAQSPHGYGWVTVYADKIALDPITGTVGASYRAIAPTGSGTIDIMHAQSSSWNGNDLATTTQFDESTFTGNQPGARYPATTAVNGFIFSVFPEMDLVSTDPAFPVKPTMSVYSVDDEESSDGIVLATEDGLYLDGAWSVVADAAYDEATSTYHMLTSWWDRNKHDGNDVYHVVVGTCDGDPMDSDDWTFSNYEDVTISMGMEDYGSLQNLKCSWGADGFGFVYGYLMDGEETALNQYNLGYTYTTDWGETWQMGANPAANPMMVLDHTPLFDWKDKFEQVVEGTDTSYVAIDGAFISNMDAVVTDDNKIHILTHSFSRYSSAPDNLFSFVFDEAGNAETVVGYYDIVGQFNGTEIVWDKAYMIANPVGLGTDEGTNYKYTNGFHIKTGYVPGTDIVYASWLDRPVERPQEAPDFHTHNRNFLDDPYFTISEDGGKTWLADTMTVYSDVAPLSFARSMMTTDLQEQGWSVAKRGMHNEKGEFVTYAANQYYIEDEPVLDPINNFASYKQDLVAFQVKMTANGITSEQKSLVKDFELLQNYPNPFNPSTSIKFNLENGANVKLTVYNSQGQKVAALVNEKKAAGAHSVNFNAAHLNSGVYFYQLNVNGMSQIKKMVLTK